MKLRLHIFTIANDQLGDQNPSPASIIVGSWQDVGRVRGPEGLEKCCLIYRTILHHCSIPHGS